MAWSVKALDSYRIWLDPRYPLGRALVDIRPVGGGAYWLWFTQATPLPANTIGPTTGTAFFAWDMLDVVLTTLREEKPVYVQTEPTLGKLSLTTALEPLGEGPVDMS